MNRLLLILALFVPFFTLTSSAQNTNYLFKDSTRLSGYIGPGYQMTAIGGQFSGQFMLKGGFVIDNKYSIGAHVAEMLNDVHPNTVPNDINIDETQSVDISYNEAGLDFYYTPKPDDLVHLSYGLTAAWGKMQVKSNETNLGDASVASLIPTVNIGVKLMPWLKFIGGVGYRFGSQLNGFEDYGINDKGFNAPNAHFGFYLGRY